jgi:Domain of unknown function (DUF1707)
MTPRSDMKASDSDRELVAERLRLATGDGRLFAHELEERLAAALRARTYGELDAVVSDLPGGRVARRPRREASHWARPALALAIAIPVAVMLVAAAVFVLTSIFAVWMMWMLVGWWFFGRHHRHHRRHRGGGPPTGYAGPRRAQPGPSSWL